MADRQRALLRKKKKERKQFREDNCIPGIHKEGLHDCVDAACLSKIVQSDLFTPASSLARLNGWLITRDRFHCWTAFACRLGAGAVGLGGGPAFCRLCLLGFSKLWCCPSLSGLRIWSASINWWRWPATWRLWGWLGTRSLTHWLPFCGLQVCFDACSLRRWLAFSSLGSGLAILSLLHRFVSHWFAISSLRSRFVTRSLWRWWPTSSLRQWSSICRLWATDTLRRQRCRFTRVNFRFIIRCFHGLAHSLSYFLRIRRWNLWKKKGGQEEDLTIFHSKSNFSLSKKAREHTHNLCHVVLRQIMDLRLDDFSLQVQFLAQ